ncbi:MAG: hypothetical protein ACFFDL_15605 [Promethearchaeota archaeon]
MSILTLGHPSVQQVLEIAEELVRENRVLNTRIIYNRAKHRLKIPRNGLLKIIQMLIDRHILINGSHFTRESVLSNEMRNYIYEIINSELGIHFSEIKRKIDTVSEISTGQLIWHLEMLLKFGLIKKIKFKNYSIFLPIEIEDQLGIIYFLLRDELNRNILRLLAKNGRMQKSSLYEDLKGDREKLYYHLNVLKDNDIIMTKEGEEDLFYIVPELEQLIKNVFKNTYIQTTQREI